MTTLRLLADDLTGSLDSAAEFVPLAGELPVFWPPLIPPRLPASAGIDSGTRESVPAVAAAPLDRLVRLLDGADIGFKKLDSLLRGATLAELAIGMRTGLWRYCALAPAFPYQRRVTRGSRQFAHTASGWLAVSDNLVAALHILGIPAYAATVGADLRPGVSVFDAETDDDLRRVVAAVRSHPDPVLWAGSGGLAQALATGCAQPENRALPVPILGLFGSDQPATADQLAACAPHWLELEDAPFDEVAVRLAGAGLALVSFRLPGEVARAAAARRIAAAIDQLAGTLDPPGTVVVAGGETLRSLCNAIGASSLLVQGRLVPGVPRSVIRGGRWDGVTVVSKSGAFGHRHLLRELLLERDRDGRTVPGHNAGERTQC